MLRTPTVLPLLAIMTTALSAHCATHAQQVEPAASAASAASAPATAPATKATLEPVDFTTRATGQIELVKGRDSPIYAEFQGSPTLTQRLRDALQAQGFELAPDGGLSKVSCPPFFAFQGSMVSIET